MKKHSHVEFNEKTLPEFDTLVKELESLEEEIKPLEETPKDEKEEVKEPEPVFMAKVTNVDKLRIRQSPDETSSVVGFLNRGDIVKINGKNVDETFLPIVTASGAEGFCMSQFLLVYEEGSYKEV